MANEQDPVRRRPVDEREGDLVGQSRPPVFEPGDLRWPQSRTDDKRVHARRSNRLEQLERGMNRGR